jgi:preprotein translocase subunit YajC
MTQYILGLAQQAPVASGQQGLTGMLIPMLVILGVMYLLVLRPQSKKAKEKRAMLSQLKNGDQVVTTGGVIGQITRINADLVTLLVSEGVRFQFQRSAITERLKQSEANSTVAVKDNAVKPTVPDSGSAHRSDFRCTSCENVLQGMGMPPLMSYSQFPTPEFKDAAEKDKFILRGLICYRCRKVFCPSCAGMQRDRCPMCKQSTLMPAHRGLLTHMGIG